MMARGPVLRGDRREHLDAVVAGIGDVDLAGGIHGHAIGAGEIAESVTQLANRGHLGADCGVFLDHPAAVPGDVDITRTIGGDTRSGIDRPTVFQYPRGADLRSLGGQFGDVTGTASVRHVDESPAVARHPSREHETGNAGDVLQRRVEFLDAVVVGVRHVQVAATVHAGMRRVVELSCPRSPGITDPVHQLPVVEFRAVGDGDFRHIEIILPVAVDDIEMPVAAEGQAAGQVQRVIGLTGIDLLRTAVGGEFLHPVILGIRHVDGTVRPTATAEG